MQACRREHLSKSTSPNELESFKVVRRHALALKPGKVPFLLRQRLPLLLLFLVRQLRALQAPLQADLPACRRELFVHDS